MGLENTYNSPLWYPLPGEGLSQGQGVLKAGHEIACAGFRACRLRV